MIKIGGPDSTRRTEIARKTRKTSASSETGSIFEALLGASEESSAASETSGTTAGAPVNSTASLLGMQEVENDPSSGRRQAQRQGLDVLEQLEQLRDEILTGTLTPQRLRNLAAMLDRPRPLFRDPRLADILDEIELRARVELAKFEADSP